MSDTEIFENENPFEIHFGYEIKKWEEDYVRIDVPLRHFHMNIYNRPHGGVYTSLLDSVMGLCGFKSKSFSGIRKGLTLSCTVNFHGVPQDDILIGEGFRTGGGKSIYFCRGQVSDGHGHLLAESTGTFRYRQGA